MYTKPKSAVAATNGDTDTDINCFGCATGNPAGLRLVFTNNGGKYESRFTLDSRYESYPGVVHGGIVATVLDEVMSQAIYQGTGTSIYTVGLRIRYAQPMRSGATHLAAAEVDGCDGALISASARIHDRCGELVAAGNGTFHRIPEDSLARLRARGRGRTA